VYLSPHLYIKKGGKVTPQDSSGVTTILSFKALGIGADTHGEKVERRNVTNNTNNVFNLLRQLLGVWLDRRTPIVPTILDIVRLNVTLIVTLIKFDVSKLHYIVVRRPGDSSIFNNMTSVGEDVPDTLNKVFL
jgi:hypothetical protein